MAGEMNVLGIETSCDETAAAVVSGGLDVLSSVVASQAGLHEGYGGVVPEIAARAHLDSLLPVVRSALDGAGLSWRGVHAIAVTSRPGLIGPLLVGVSFAKSAAWGLGCPLVGVDHVQAHLHAGLLGLDRAAVSGVYPAVGLVVSGGHSSLYRCEGPIRLERLGATIDDAMGEAYDKVATMLGLPYPGGPHLDRLAREGEERGEVGAALPVSRLGRDSLDMSFSGLKTAALYAIRGVPDRSGRFPREASSLDPSERRAIAASFQRAACEAVVLKVERALERVAGVRSLVVGGGVASNSRLRAALDGLASDRGLRLVIPDTRYCIDNAAMIAGLGHELLAAGVRDGAALSPVPTTAC